MLHSNIIEQRFRYSLSHFTQKSLVLRACYLGAMYKVISAEALEWFCLCMSLFESVPSSFFLLLPHLSIWIKVKARSSSPVTWSSIIHWRCCLRFYPWCETLLCCLYSCHLQTTQQPSNLIRRFKVVSSFSIDFSADVRADCGPFEHNGEDQRMWMLLCCRVLL